MVFSELRKGESFQIIFQLQVTENLLDFFGIFHKIFSILEHIIKFYFVKLMMQLYMPCYGFF